MSKPSFFGNLKALKQNMANMTYKEKLVHIWTYYKWVLIVVLILIMGVSVLLAVAQNKQKILLLGGVTVNAQLSEEGRNYLREDYLQVIGTGNKHETIDLGHTNIASLQNTTTYEDNYFSVMSLMALCSNEELDYMIMDQEGFETMLIRGAYLGLDQVYTPEELEKMEDQVIYAKNGETQIPNAVALDITDCAFTQEHINTSGKVYFVYVINSPRVEACREFYNYLLAYE